MWGGIPLRRMGEKNQPVKLKYPTISKESLEIAKKVNTSNDLILILAESKTTKFQIFTDHRQIETIFEFQRLHYKRGEILLH